MSVDYMNLKPGAVCACGKEHCLDLKDVVIGKGAIRQLPACLEKLGAKKPFLLMDVNTQKAAGEKVAALLEEEGIAYGRYVFQKKALKPDEWAVGSAVMHFDHSCDCIVTVGSGVLNDIGKILSNTAKVPCIIVGTAPSMDGYASASSSMDMDGLKISLSSRCPDIIIGDTDILKNAPMRMLQSGLGDMLAKYVSICEWRISHLINGEYYCEKVAALVRLALKRCTDNAEGLLKRDEKAVEAVFEGLVIGGAAMTYAGVSRPASGVEHYFSHLWDMRGLEFGTPADLHGIQCAIGTLMAVKLYERIKTLTPDPEKAEAFVKTFSFEDWAEQLRTYWGKGAEAMIALEAKEQKYSVEKHSARLPIILAHWQKILAIMEEELPSSADLEKLLDTIGAPKTPAEIGIDPAILPVCFKATKDIRDKYIVSRLAWDLGVLDDLAKEL